MSSAGQGQFAGQRPAFRQLCYATNSEFKYTSGVAMPLPTVLKSDTV